MQRTAFPAIGWWMLDLNFAAVPAVGENSGSILEANRFHPMQAEAYLRIQLTQELDRFWPMTLVGRLDR